MISVAYKKQLKDFQLDVDFKLPEKGITVLFGPSGSGKTSLLNLLSGLGESEQSLSHALSHAKFSLNETIYDDSEQGLFIPPWKRNIAYVFQDNRLFPHMTIEQNILFGFKRRNSSLEPETIIQKFKIEDFMQRYPAQLSGGQKQRVAMVRALLSGPELLILDEPLAALDYQSRQELLPFIECIHKELTIPVIYVSHDIKEVLRLADHIVVMQGGKVIDQGELAALCIDQPLLTQSEGASFILQGIVHKIIGEDKLVEVQCENTNLLITGQNMQLGKQVRILIHARDVSLCLSPPENTSILNCVPIVIEALREDTNGKLQVISKIGQQRIVAMISHRSARQLEIAEDREMYAQFKATAMIK